MPKSDVTHAPFPLKVRSRSSGAAFDGAAGGKGQIAVRGAAQLLAFLPFTPRSPPPHTTPSPSSRAVRECCQGELQSKYCSYCIMPMSAASRHLHCAPDSLPLPLPLPFVTLATASARTALKSRAQSLRASRPLQATLAQATRRRRTLPRIMAPRTVTTRPTSPARAPKQLKKRLPSLSPRPHPPSKADLKS